MPIHPRPHGQERPVPEQVNARIRHLMSKPASRNRTAEYARLLALWAEATRDSFESAA
ncbi:hypothetical protein [Streptomyces cadmiisoli]|uniref:hypothetical protein n=1 Tax=Streptomyces cadmiisoli TaxID=2184053 RepID=UPI0036494677